ncbi:hypothetical protein EYF80_021770 [Liparis tanakae]|uniref:Uncharacterized protein n=1 Tax=Liparis tanakae TaxID=230148 RepID=A0A4Z2HQF0_9TELE|nr:hypothetical protein EYF80_021770 [Liparis tanakae]
MGLQHMVGTCVKKLCSRIKCAQSPHVALMARLGLPASTKRCTRPRAAGNIKGRMFMMDGQLFKEKHHRVLDGRDPIQEGCDVTRQTGTSFSPCRDVKQGES